MGELHPRAHDMHREFRVISALWQTGVPVAQPYGECQDCSITGAHFYVMGFVDGNCLNTPERVREFIPTAEERRHCGESLVDVLAALHSLDPDEIGLGSLGRRDDYAGRQLRAWYRSWTMSAPQASFDDSRVHEIHDFLWAHRPATTDPRLLHGDYGLHNCLVGANAAIAAVVDWELASLGDATSDLAYVVNQLVQDAESASGDSHLLSMDLMRRDELIRRYQERSPRDLSLLNYYIALNLWRSACILHGVYTRYVQGQKQTTGVDVERFRDEIDQCIDKAESAASEL
jgi:aminoglycoside phosphotransferase (APT) family kinase protein